MMAHRLIIKGTVQGVLFRKYTKDKAKELNIKGWVRNLPDGSVEIVAQGEERNMREFIAWCKHGPPNAIVTEFNEDETGVEFFTEFAVVK